MFGESDVLALFAPSTPENRHIVNRYSIGRMKKGVIIINTARGVCVAIWRHYHQHGKRCMCGHMAPSLPVDDMGCCVECPEVPHVVSVGRRIRRSDRFGANCTGKTRRPQCKSLAASNSGWCYCVRLA
jgi:hypothetical protein